jgi:hypothetical protein
MVGAMVGAAERADALARSYEVRLDEARAEPHAPARPKVFFEEWDEPLISAIGWVSELVETAGGDDIFPERAKQAGAQGRIVSSGDVVAASPTSSSAPGAARNSSRRRSGPPRLRPCAGRRQQPPLRNQIVDHPAARPGRADRRAGCDAKDHRGKMMTRNMSDACGRRPAVSPRPGVRRRSPARPAADARGAGLSPRPGPVLARRPGAGLPVAGVILFTGWSARLTGTGRGASPAGAGIRRWRSTAVISI